MIRPIVIGTHQYEWAVNAFSWLFAKYWPGQELLYIGDHVLGRLMDHVTFRQVPCFTEGIWPWEHWFGRGLCSVFEAFPDDLIVLFLPDHWLYEPVDVKGIEALGRYMETRPQIVRGNLTAGQALYTYGIPISDWEEFDIWRADPANQHASLEGGLTFPPSLWNPKAALELIEPGWTLHQCENLGTEKMRDERRDLYSVGISPAPIHRSQALYHEKHYVVFLKNLCPEDVPFVKQCIPENWTVVE